MTSIGTNGSALYVSRSAGGVTTTTRGLLLAHVLKRAADSRARASPIVRITSRIDQFLMAVPERVVAFDLVGSRRSLGEHAPIVLFGSSLPPIEEDGLLGEVLGREHAAGGGARSPEDQQHDSCREDRQRGRGVTPLSYRRVRSNAVKPD